MGMVHLGAWRQLCAAVSASLLATSFVIMGSTAASARPTSPPTMRATTLNSSLNGVVVLGSRNVWAVGNFPSGGRYEPVSEHWNGTDWTQIIVPAERGRDVGFSRADASGPDNIWAIGSFSRGPAELSFVDRWDGTRWTDMAVPNPSVGPVADDILQGLSVVSPTDVWVDGTAGGVHPWVEHWDGSRWTRLAFPSFGGPGDTYLAAISALSEQDVWVSGMLGYGGRGNSETLIARWDGSRWIRFPTPSIPNAYNLPWSLDLSSTTNGWSAGFADGSTHGYPLLLHWNGFRWSLQRLKQSDYRLFYDVSSSSPTSAWAVGQTGLHEFTLHWDGTAWHRVGPPANVGSLIAVDDRSDQLAATSGEAADGNAIVGIWNGTGWTSHLWPGGAPAQR